jgi:transposase
VRTVAAPWARPGSGFTLLFEAFVLLLARQMPVATLAASVGEHDTRLWRILEHHVQEARAAQDGSGVQHLGIDETACRAGHEYVSLLVDLEQGQVLSVAEGHDTGTVRDLARDFAAHHGDPRAVTAVCLDLSLPLQRGVRQHFPEAVVVLDRFHIMQLVNTALGEIRRAEVPQDARLKGTRSLWLTNPEHLTARQQQRLAGLLDTDLVTAQAYRWKRELQAFWDQPDRKTAARELDRWCRQLATSELPYLGPLQRVARTLTARRDGLLNYFTARLTNGFLEGLNSFVQAARHKARGYRSVRYFATMIYLLGGLVPPLPT